MTQKIDMCTNGYSATSDGRDHLEKGVIKKYQNFLGQDNGECIVLPTKKMDQAININGLLHELQQCQRELKEKKEELRQVHEVLETTHAQSFKISKQAIDFSGRFDASPAYEKHVKRGYLPDNRHNIAYYFDNMATGRGNEAELCMAAAAFEAQEGIIVTNANKVILRINKAFTHITGYTTEDMVGENFDWFHAGFHNVDFYKTIFDVVSTNGYWQGEIWNKHKNGELFPVLQSITGVRNLKGEISYYIGTLIDIAPQKKTEKILLDTCSQLENKVNNTQEELKKNKAEIVEISAALTVLLKYRETDKSDAQAALSKEIETTILPFLKKLQRVNANRQQTNHLLEILEINLDRLIKSYGCPNNLLSAYQKLTPIETQVAIMVRQNFPTKTIASTLNIAPGTVAIHRKHIRKKLGLANKATNLHSYLLLLTE